MMRVCGRCGEELLAEEEDLVIDGDKRACDADWCEFTCLLLPLPLPDTPENANENYPWHLPIRRDMGLIWFRSGNEGGTD